MASKELDLKKFLDSTKFKRKLESLKEENNKYLAREAIDNWRKHVPVYGWTKINYPTGIQYPLREKYREEKKRKILEQEEKDREERERLRAEMEKKKQEEEERQEREAKAKLEGVEEPKEEKKEVAPPPKPKSKNRVDPETVNNEVLKDLENLIPIDYSKNFLQNYRNNDFGFLKNQFMKYEQQKNNINIDCTAPGNYTKLITDGSNNFLYQLGIKKAFAYLTTASYEEKCKFIDVNLLYDQKYCTMYPKNSMLGPKPDETYEVNNREVTDISFEEEKKDENLSNLARLPPENITEEWVKENLRENVSKINFENCYWLSKDLVSKLGRLDKKLKVISLRNLDLTNYVVENILAYANEVESLDLSNCTGLTSGLLEIISDHGPKLLYLNLFGLGSAINDGGLVNLGNKCPTLKGINLGKCREVTDKGIKGILCGSMKRFEKLSFTFNDKITDEGIKKLLEYSEKTLKEFTMNFMPKITEDALNGLSKCKELYKVEMISYNGQVNYCGAIYGLEKLEEVDISGCQKITDADAANLAMNNQRLRVLRLNGCPLTKDFIDRIIENKVSLLILQINRCTAIPDASIDALVEKYKPNLRVIRATNLVWPKKHFGIYITRPSDNYVKPTFKGAKKPAAKKNDDKSPEIQLIKLREEMKPKMIYEYYLPEIKKTGKKGKK